MTPEKTLARLPANCDASLVVNIIHIECNLFTFVCKSELLCSNFCKVIKIYPNLSFPPIHVLYDRYIHNTSKPHFIIYHPKDIESGNDKGPAFVCLRIPVL